MAVVEPKSMAVSLATPKSRMFTVDIAMSGFTDAETTAGGRLSPCHADDFATKPTTLAQSLLVSRGLLSTGVSDSSDATAITITSDEEVGIGETSEIGENVTIYHM